MQKLESLNEGNFSLIWGYLRNLVDFDSIEVSDEINLIGTHSGEFPVNSFHPIYLEIPRLNEKLDLSGRKNQNNFTTSDTVNWYQNRVISLPIYKHDENAEIKGLQSMISSWNKYLVPEEIPCIAVAFKTIGSYTDERVGQYVIVLLIWATLTARILELDWYEGPLEDCISPEWYIHASELMTPSEALSKIKSKSDNQLNWQNPLFSIFTIPSFLEIDLHPEQRKVWKGEWKNELIYRDYFEYLRDIQKIVKKISEIVS